MPELRNKFNGISTRVPVACGALSELVITFEQKVTPELINSLALKYTKDQLNGIVEYTTDPIVSSDVLGNTHSCVFDSLATKVINENTAQIILWYDNEIGYSNRLVDLVLLMAKQMV
jgi:glyceraldehyde 3-phosphate dehydrogenase